MKKQEQEKLVLLREKRKLENARERLTHEISKLAIKVGAVIMAIIYAIKRL